jgi:hypothetical protein
LNPEPEIVTAVPDGPLVGENDDAARMLNALVVVAFPPGVTTEITVEIAVAGIVAWIEFVVSDVIAALARPISTEVAPSRSEPEIVTVSPATPLAGEKPEITGTGWASAAGARAPATAATTIATIDARRPGISRATLFSRAHRCQRWARCTSSAPGVSISGWRRDEPSLFGVANANDGTLSVYPVAPSGALTEVTGSPFTTGAGAQAVAFDPAGPTLI